MSGRRTKALKRFTRKNEEKLGIFFNIDIGKYSLYRKVKNFYRKHKVVPNV